MNFMMPVIPAENGTQDQVRFGILTPMFCAPIPGPRQMPPDYRSCQGWYAMMKFLLGKLIMQFVSQRKTPMDIYGPRVISLQIIQARLKSHRWVRGSV